MRPVSEPLCMRLMEQYDDTFEPADDVPTIKEIEKRLRRLGCTKEQVSHHLEQVTKGRTKPAPKRSRIVLTGLTGPSGRSITHCHHMVAVAALVHLR